MMAGPDLNRSFSGRRRLLQLALLGMAATLLPACRNGATLGVGQGSRFPDIRLPYLDGRAAVFADAAPMVVNFWASWCEPCRREMPSLEKLSTLFPPQELTVVGISVDDDINLAREFSLHYRPTFQMLSDSNQTLSKGVLQIRAFPVSYLLKRDRTIARIVTGAEDWAAPAAVDEIEALLAVRRHSVG
jgi:thiol-disulfide isomerase/thioredoxin